jgi:hypothetical protein
MAIAYSYGTFYLTCVVFGIVFCFDLWKRNARRRKLLAVVILSGVATFLVIFLAYALVQKNAADRQQREAEMSLEKAVKSGAQD